MKKMRSRGGMRLGMISSVRNRVLYIYMKVLINKITCLFVYEL